MVEKNTDIIFRQDAINTLRNNITYMQAFGADRSITLINELPSAEDKRIKQIAELVEGTIDHFDREDAMDLLYQIKEVLNEG